MKLSKNLLGIVAAAMVATVAIQVLPVEVSAQPTPILVEEPGSTVQQAGAAKVSFALTMAIAGLVFILAVIAVVSTLSSNNQARRQRERTALIEKFLQAGQPVPPEILSGPIDRRTPEERIAEARSRHYRHAVVLLALAVAIAAIFYIGFGNWRSSAWGLLFFLLSIACFINGRYFPGERPRDPNN
jgi:hypothetical protein